MRNGALCPWPQHDRIDISLLMVVVASVVTLKKDYCKSVRELGKGVTMKRLGLRRLGMLVVFSSFVIVLILVACSKKEEAVEETTPATTSTTSTQEAVSSEVET